MDAVLIVGPLEATRFPTPGHGAPTSRHIGGSGFDRDEVSRPAGFDGGGGVAGRTEANLAEVAAAAFQRDPMADVAEVYSL